MRAAMIKAGITCAEAVPPKNPRKYDVLYRTSEANLPCLEHHHGCSSIDTDDWRARANAKPVVVTRTRSN